MKNISYKYIALILLAATPNIKAVESNNNGGDNAIEDRNEVPTPEVLEQAPEDYNNLVEAIKDLWSFFNMKGDGQILDMNDQEYRELWNAAPEKLKLELKKLEPGWAEYYLKRQEGTMSEITLRDLNYELKDGNRLDTMINRVDEMLNMFLETTNGKINSGPTQDDDDNFEDILRKKLKHNEFEHKAIKIIEIINKKKENIRKLRREFTDKYKKYGEA